MRILNYKSYIASFLVCAYGALSAQGGERFNSFSSNLTSFNTIDHSEINGFVPVDDASIAILSSPNSSKTIEKSSEKSGFEPARGFYVKDNMTPGSIRGGAILGLSQSTVNNSEYVIFADSDLLRTSVDLPQSLSIPVFGTVEYQITKKFSVGAFIGAQRKTNDNEKNSKGITIETVALNYGGGAYVSYFMPIETWLYSNTTLRVPIESGSLESDDQSTFESYDYFRYGVDLDMGATIVIRQRVTVTLSGVTLSYRHWDYNKNLKLVGFSDPNGDGVIDNKDIEYSEQKISHSTLFFQNLASIKVQYTMNVGSTGRK